MSLDPPVPRPRRGRRRAAAVVLGATIVLGLLVHRALPGSAATDIAGDALYALAAYAGLVLLLPARPRAALGALAAAWCLAVELFQLTGIPLALAGAFPPVALVLGTGFDARDLLVYVLAVALAAGIDEAASRRAPA